MTPATPDIFLSYRREDSAGHTGRLADALGRRFGAEHVFQDVEGIAPGEDFVEAVQRAIARCDVVLVVIGRDWLGARDGAGERRLDDPGDHVRQEIVAALAREDVRIIPLLVENATMPRAADLPAALAPLARRNALPLSDIGWEDDVARLIAAIERTRATARVAAADPRPRNRLLTRVAIGGGVVGLLVIAALALRDGDDAVPDPAADASTPELPAAAPLASRPLRMAGPYEASLGMATVALRALRIDSLADGRRLVATFRLDNHAQVPLEFLRREFELDQGSGFADALGSDDVEVPAGASADVDMAFALELTAGAAVLRFRHAAEFVEVPLDLRAGFVAAPEPPPAVLLEIAPASAEPLSIGAFDVVLERAAVRRFVNRDLVTVTLQLRNTSAQVQRFSSVQLQLVADETVEPTFIDFEVLVPPGGTAVDSAVFRTASGALPTVLRFFVDEDFTLLPLARPSASR